VKVCMISGANQEEPYGSTIRPTYLAIYSAQLGIEISHYGKNHPSIDEIVPGLNKQDISEESLLRRFNSLYKELKHSPPDVIYTHQIQSGKLGLILSYFLHRPHVYDAHSSISFEAPTFKNSPVQIRRRQFYYERMIIKLSSKVIVPSIELKEFLIDKYRLNPDRFAIVKNGVERKRFFPLPPDESLRRNLGIEKDAFIVVITNPRLPTFPSNDMALQYLFDVIPSIEKNVSRIKFLILGGGPELRPPSDNIIYTGYVNDIPSYINLADVCVVPYPAQAVCGGTRTKVCEYLACGKPIVATEEGMRGFDDAVPGKHYFLAKNADDFIHYVIECFNAPDKAKQIGENARQLSEKYDWSYLSRGLERCLSEVLSS